MTTTLPKYDDFMQPTLQAVRDLGGSASIEEIQDKLTEMMGLTQAQLDAAYPKSGALIATDRMSWARSHLKIAGLLASGGKGVWVLTDAGREAANLSPAQVKAEVKKLRASHHANVVAKRAQVRAGADQEGAELQDDDWADKLLAKVKSISPAAFERLSQRLLRRERLCAR